MTAGPCASLAKIGAIAESGTLTTTSAVRGAASLEDLLCNRIAAIRIGGFVGEDSCARLASRITNRDFEEYRGISPSMYRIGITQYEHASEPRSYFANVEHVTTQRKEIFKGPVILVQELLTSAWGEEVAIAVNDSGRSYFAGLLRATPQALTHVDWAPQDAKGWEVGQATAQLAWNIYYSVPRFGGELVIYDCQWTPCCERARHRLSYGYDDGLVADRRSVKISPSMGDLIIFNSRNMHSVCPSDVITQRITASSFVGLVAGAKLVLWS